MKKFAKITAVVLVAVFALAFLVACGPAADPDKAVAALKKNGYTAGKLTTSSYAGVEAVVSGSKGALGALVGKDEFQTITIFYFKDAASANDAWESIKSESDKSSDKKNSDWVVKKSGKIIYYGTKQAAKDAQ